MRRAEGQNLSFLRRWKNPLEPVASFEERCRDLRSLIPRFEAALRDNIVGFWLPRCIDTAHGGYRVGFGAGGEPAGETSKPLVVQARMLWLFARLAREDGFDSAAMLQAAAHGHAFLREKLLDARHGGYFWEVDERGGHAVCSEKHLYGQAFALYALSQYAQASGRAEVLTEADRLFELLERAAHDPAHGGYRESFAADWTPLPRESTGCMGQGGLKLLNTHLHLLEALSAYYRAGGRGAARERIVELILVLASAVVRKGPVACTDEHERDWRPRAGEAARVSYGHDLESVWLLQSACETIGLPHAPLHDLFRALCDYALRHGYDRRHGGFYLDGPLGRAADRKQKEWWVQAEALVGLLHMGCLLREPRYLGAFEQTWRWVDTRQIDWACGEWHATILPNGRAQGAKGNRWKAGYHTGRAMLECLASLRSLG